jgi:hypothetical protein
MAYVTGTYFAPISKNNGRNFKLVGYWLSGPTKDIDGASHEFKSRLDDHCSHQGCQLNAVEWDSGPALNPMRVGLWRALRRLVCDSCPPKRMSMTHLCLDDFINDALTPCMCGSNKGLEGLIVTSLKHLSTDQLKGSQIIFRLAEIGKHVIADDGICLSCCHPATKKLLLKKRLLVCM